MNSSAWPAPRSATTSFSQREKACRFGLMRHGYVRWAGPAYGVKGVDLADGDEVIGMVVANGDLDAASLLTVCARGYGKRTLLTEYRTQNRGGKGLIDIQTNERNGPVVAVSKVTDEDEVMLTTNRGMVIRTKVSTMRTIGRNTLGVRLIKLDEGDTVSSVAKLPLDELTDAGDLETTGPDGEPEGSNGETSDGPFEEPHRPHIIDDGVGEAEASDHIDSDSEDDDTLGPADESSV